MDALILGTENKPSDMSPEEVLKIVKKALNKKYPGLQFRLFGDYGKEVGKTVYRLVLNSVQSNKHTDIFFVSCNRIGDSYPARIWSEIFDCVVVNPDELGEIIKKIYASGEIEGAIRDLIEA